MLVAGLSFFTNIFIVSSRIHSSDSITVGKVFKVGINYYLMFDYDLLEGKSLAIIIYNSKDEKDVRVYRGTAIQKEDGFHFINEEEKWRIALTPDMLSRIKEVQPELKRILLNADYAVSITLGFLPGDSTDGFEPTGIKWL